MRPYNRYILVKRIKQSIDTPKSFGSLVEVVDPSIHREALPVGTKLILSEWWDKLPYVVAYRDHSLDIKAVDYLNIVAILDEDDLKSLRTV